MRSSIGKCNCKALDALAGEFTKVASRKAMRSVLLGNAIADCETHLAGGFRGRVKRK